MSRCPRIVLLLSLCAAAAHADPPPRPREAAALNQQGLDAHRRGDYEKASELFRQATEADARIGVYPYNLACALAQLRKQGRQCDAMFTDVLELLRTAVSLDPQRKKRALEDPDLEEFRHTVLFALWAGGSYETERGIRDLLPKVRWDSTQVHGDGVVGGETTFRPDGTLAMTPPNTGTWSVSGRRVTLKLHYRKPIVVEQQQVYELEFNDTFGTLKAVTPETLSLSDHPDECNL